MRKTSASLAALTITATALASAVLAGPAQASVNHSCFGYTGTFGNATTAYPTFSGPYIFANGSQNCIGTSPARRIFDTSPGHPWYQIPGGGLADGVVNAYNYTSGSAFLGKIYQVVVGSSGNFWCQTWLVSSGWQTSWGRCGSENNTAAVGATADNGLLTYVNSINASSQRSGQATNATKATA